MIHFKKLNQEYLEKIYIFLLAAIQFIHIVYFVVLMPLGPIIMNDLNIGPAQFAGLVSSYNFSAAISGLLFASIADRFDRKKLLIGVLLAFTFGALLCAQSPTYNILLLSRIFTGAFGGILTSVILTIVSDLIAYERRGKAIGVIMSAFSIASIIGIPLGLVLAEGLGWRSTFYAVSATSLFILISCYIFFPGLSSYSVKEGFLETLSSYLKLLFRKEYLKSFALIFIVAHSMFLIFPFLSPYAVKNIGIAVGDLKYMYFFAGIATIFTANFFGRMTDTLGGERVFMTLCLISIIPVLMYTNAPEMKLIPFIMMATFFMTIVSGRMIPCMTVLTRVPDSLDRGRYMAVLNSVRAFGASIATLVSGFMMSQNEKGQILGLDRVGHLSVVLILFSIFLMFFIFYRPEKLKAMDETVA